MAQLQFQFDFDFRHTTYYIKQDIKEYLRFYKCKVVKHETFFLIFSSPSLAAVPT